MGTREKKSWSSNGFPAANSSDNSPSTYDAGNDNDASVPQSPQKSPQKRIITTAPPNGPPPPPTSHASQCPNTKKRSSTSSEDECAICKIIYESDEDIAKEPQSSWIRCCFQGKMGGKRGCNWCIHAACVGIFCPIDQQGELALSRWSSGHFYCPRHMPSQ